MTRRARWTTAILLAATGLLAVTVIGWHTDQCYCLGHCHGETLDCAGVERWLSEVSAEDVRGVVAARRRVHRIRYAYIGDLPCGSERWDVGSTDPRVWEAIQRRAREHRPLTVTVRYVNAAADSDEIGLDAMGIEASGWEDWRLMTDGHRLDECHDEERVSPAP